MVQFGFRPDPPSVAMDDALDRGQSDTGAIEFLDRVQSLERAKQLVRVLHLETGAIVAHVENWCGLARLHTKVNVRYQPSRCVLPRISDYVRQGDLQQARVALGDHRRFNRYHDITVR